jgi:hypothetical protein
VIESIQNGRAEMVRTVNHWRSAAAAVALVAAGLIITPAAAQPGDPIKIGYSMALTGGLAANGKSFKDVSTQVVVTPPAYDSGELTYPYEKAK